MEDRFWRCVKRGTDDECWEWLKGKNTGGYGRYCVNATSVLAHRYAWELVHGPIPEGMVVRHKCRGKCVNPNHLEVGTQAENVRDRERDGTDNRGERHGLHKLTEAQVREIVDRLQHRKHGDIRRLAEEYAVCRTTIVSIKEKSSWGLE